MIVNVMGMGLGMVIVCVVSGVIVVGDCWRWR